ncbi:porin [Parendozoicomonas sp. Alg238-R29]|uniref:OprO/OprP family phosphate-selective porin n=1 Tax=Parendozoicomonas sp. Alg238-R29 TaxID=2993446 RepID=UPI00248E35B0|nr:porin [Parendozoicomonas sp. Alg238-R29]
MKRTAISLAVAAAMSAGLAMNAQAGTVKTEGEDIIISTKNGGFSAKTESGDFSFKVSGKLQWDYAGFGDVYTHDSDNDAYKDSTTGYIRRGEVKFSGKAYKDFKYALKLAKDDDDKFEVDDAYIEYLGLDPVELRFGRWGRGFGLEDSVSSSWIMGIERPMMYDVLEQDGGNKYGVRAGVFEKNYTAHFGIHHDKRTDKNNSKDDLFGYTFRATAAPVMTDNMLVHVGFDYANTNVDESKAEKSSTKLGVKKADSISLFSVDSADEDSVYILEGAAQFGSLQLQGEYFVRTIDGKNAETDVDVKGYYAQVSYMLDGGKRTYKKGEFSKPKGGQWEVFARYSEINVDADVNASKGVDTSKDVDAEALTLGVNYFATKNVRASVNYINSDTSNRFAKNATATNGKKIVSDGSAVVGRLQYVF